MKNALLGLVLLAAAVPASAWERLEGQYSGVRDFHTEAVKDEASWKALWERHAPGQPVPQVEFAQEQVVAVFLGQTLSGGVKVEVAVRPDPLDPARMVVFYKPVKTGGAFGTTVVSHPFVLLKTPRAAAVVFEANGRVSVAPRARPENPLDGRRVGVLLETLAAPSFDGR